MRLDKWIWAVRMVKTRTMATNACKLNRVTLNGQVAKPAKEIKVGDVIQVSYGKNPAKIHRVEGFIAKPSTPERVAQYFTDLTPAEPEKSADFLPAKKEKKVIKKGYNKDQGRPVKRDRRTLDKLDSMWE